jgi:hypothetical protein
MIFSVFGPLVGEQPIIFAIIIAAAGLLALLMCSLLLRSITKTDCIEEQYDVEVSENGDASQYL